MALATPTTRTHIHTRNIAFHGYLREDGLWDIEAELLDRREYAYVSRDQSRHAAPSTVHNMLLRVTLDDHMVIQAITSSMATTPFGECSQAADPLQKLVGARLGGGWRRTIDAAMGGVAGCTHLRELLFNVATAAFQTIPVYRNNMRRGTGDTDLQPVHLGRPPPHFGKCMSWDFNGPVMKRVAPEFYGWTPPAE